MFVPRDRVLQCTVQGSIHHCGVASEDGSINKCLLNQCMSRGKHRSSRNAIWLFSLLIEEFSQKQKEIRISWCVLQLLQVFPQENRRYQAMSANFLSLLTVTTETSPMFSSQLLVLLREGHRGTTGPQTHRYTSLLWHTPPSIHVCPILDTTVYHTRLFLFKPLSQAD